MNYKKRDRKAKEIIAMKALRDFKFQENSLETKLNWISIKTFIKLEIQEIQRYTEFMLDLNIILSEYKKT
jgi:hypothetical protein